jgi:hypothetical protein
VIELRALSVRQPWAQLIVEGSKDVENRTWSTPYRGIVAVHAALQPDPFGWRRYVRAGDVLAFGAIIGWCTLVRVTTDAISPWAAKGLQHWELDDAHQLEEPIPLQGARGLFTLMDFTAERLREQMSLVVSV